MKIDEKLQKLRKASGLSQEALADKLNISRQAVSKWESGVSYPETDKLIQMSKIFNCSLDELVNDTETDKSIYPHEVYILVGRNGYEIGPMPDTLVTSAEYQKMISTIE